MKNSHRVIAQFAPYANAFKPFGVTVTPKHITDNYEIDEELLNRGNPLEAAIQETLPNSKVEAFNDYIVVDNEKVYYPYTEQEMAEALDMRIEDLEEVGVIEMDRFQELTLHDELETKTYLFKFRRSFSSDEAYKSMKRFIGE